MILVTGGSGLLGRSLAALSTPERPVVALGRDALDICDAGSVAAALAAHRPDAVVNAAAMTDVDGCERDPQAAHRANVDGPRTLARACREAGARLVHVSTDFVFDGTKREPYTIEDAPNPLSVYGRTKLEGEEAVRAELADAVVARTSWVFGKGGKNFASRLFEYAAKTSVLKGITDMRSVPTYAPDLAARLVEILALGAPGTYHVTGSGDATWFDVAREALDLAGRSDVTLLPTTVAELGLPAPRPAYSVMRCLASERLGLAPLRHWRTALGQFVHSLS
jgi:dTDP-4-dehydrorhamnose reductase/4-ketoreductase